MCHTLLVAQLWYFVIESKLLVMQSVTVPRNHWNTHLDLNIIDDSSCNHIYDGWLIKVGVMTDVSEVDLE